MQREVAMDINLRLMVLEKKIENLEQQLQLLQQTQQSQKSHQHSNQETMDTKAVAPVSPSTPSAEETPIPAHPEKKPIDWEHLIARVWLPRIFIVVFLLGVMWGFTAVVNAGFITEPVRCLIGLVVAGFMYGFGIKQIALQRQALGQVLLGGSIAVLMLSLFAAHMLYDLIPSTLAFVLFILSISLGVITSLRRASEPLTIVMMMGGFLIPFLMNSDDPNVWIFVGYLTLFSIAMMIISHRYAYRYALYVAFGLLHLPLLIGYLSIGSDTSHYIFLSAVLLQHLVLFSLFNPSIILYLGFVFLASWTFGLYETDHPFVVSVILLGFTLVYSITAFWMHLKNRVMEIYVSIATLGLFLFLINQLDSGNLYAAILAQGTIAIILGVSLKSKLQQLTGVATYIVGFIAVLFSEIDTVLSSETLAWVILITSIGVIYYYLRKRKAMEETKSSPNFLLWINSVLFLVFISHITNVLTAPLSTDVQYLLLSVAWVVYAVVIILFGVMKGIKKARLAGVLFLFITLLKMIFIDLPDVSTAVRAALFLGLGGVGVAVSRLFYKKQ